MSFPCRNFEQDPSGWSSIGTRNPGTPVAAETRSGFVPVAPGHQAFVGVQEIGTGATWAKVEFNPSRVLDPEGHSLAPIEALADVIPMVFRAAAELVEPPEEIGTARVKRVDVARDFEVERPAFYVQGLGPIKRPWARRNGVYNDPSRSNAQTLHVGSGAGGVRLYDKHAETDGGVPEGTLRWEAEARSGWVQNYGDMRVVDDLTVENLTRLAMDRWEWSAMGVEVAATERVIEAVQRADLSPAEQRGFLGHLLLQAHGRATPLSNDTASKFNRLQRQLGVVLGADTRGAGFVGRLDWETGREVVRVA